MKTLLSLYLILIPLHLFPQNPGESKDLFVAWSEPHLRVNATPADNKYGIIMPGNLCINDTSAYSRLTVDNAIFPSGAVKTNLLPWSVAVMNIEGEIFLHPHISVALALSWSPWFLSRNFAPRILAILPEGRWWLHSAGKGHFFGLHIATAWFNLKYGDFRYQDSGMPLINAGVTYGYHFSIKKRLGIELAAGVGYASLRYDRYHNVDNGALIDTRRTSWFGIDRISLSVSYSLPGS